MNQTAKAILKAQKKQGGAVQMIPCTIATVTPLTVNIFGTVLTALRVPGLTYTVAGTAVALYSSPNMPIILPTGA